MVRRSVYAIRDDKGNYVDENSIFRKEYISSQKYKSNVRLYFKDEAEKVIEILKKNLHRVDKENRNRTFELMRLDV